MSAAMSGCGIAPLPKRYRRSPKPSLIGAAAAEFGTQAGMCAASMNTQSALLRRALDGMERGLARQALRAALVLCDAFGAIPAARKLE
ncbi:hypothetical protein GGR77_001438 [Xanthomonas translucens]